MEAHQVMERFRKAGALLEGHFALSSGLHSNVYLQCALVLQFPRDAAMFAAAIAEHFREQKIQLVASPAIGGIVIGHEVARVLGARFIWTEREQGQMTLRRGFSVTPGERTLVVEDVITTGGSTKDTVALLRDTKAEVIAAASIIDRSAGKADVGVPLFSLATITVATTEPADCLSCKRGEPLVKPGSRISNQAGQGSAPGV